MIVKTRHTKFVKIARALVAPFINFRTGFVRDKVSLKEPGPYLIVANHVSAFDPIHVTDLLNQQVYYVASELLFSNGIISRLLEYCFAPIPKTKSKVDPTTVKTIIKVVKEGGSVGIFAEGNSTFDGATMDIVPSIGKLVLLLKIPLVIINFRGGYLKNPRWSKKHRHGKQTAFVREVITYEQYKDYTAEQISTLIKTKIDVNAYQVNTDLHSYHGRHNAEGLERLLFTCPSCGMPDNVFTKNNRYSCNHCHFTATYDQYGYLNSKIGRFDTVTLNKICLYKFHHYLQVNHNYEVKIEGKLFEIFTRTRRRLGSITVMLTKNNLLFTNKQDNKLYLLDDIETVAVQQKRTVIIYFGNGKTLAVKLKNNYSAYQFLQTFSYYKTLKGGNG